MAKVDGTRVIAGIVPFDDTDAYPTHSAEYGKGGLRTVATESDLTSIPEPQQTEYMLAAVSDQGGTLFQLVDKAADTWEQVDTGGGFIPVSSTTERDNIPTSLREEGLVSAVTNGATADLYQLRGGTANSDWVEVSWLTPSELTTKIDDAVGAASGADEFPNRSLLVQITSSGSGSIITTAERALLHEHTNRTVLDQLLSAGSGDVITTAERNNLHTHGNKAVIDSIINAGSTKVITDAERSSLDSLEQDQHSHNNKAELDDIINAGSGSIITAAERDRISSVDFLKTSDFSLTPTDGGDLFRIDPSGATDQEITVTLPDDSTGYGSLWSCFFLQTGVGNVIFEAGGGAIIRSPFDYNTTPTRGSLCGVFHFPESGTSIWHLEGRLI